MISFFRKIRKKMLNNNEFSRYLLYAFGEIALIIVGILIALNVNNYSESLKNKAIKRQLLTQLQQENRLNLEDLQSDKAYRDTLGTTIYRFHQMLQEDDLTQQSELLQARMAAMLRGTIYDLSDKYLNKYITSYADDNSNFTAELIMLDTYQNGLEIVSSEAQKYRMEKFVNQIVKTVDFETLDIYDYAPLETLEFRNNVLLMSNIEGELLRIYRATLQQQMRVDSMLTVELR